jgi:hypothetical protein
MTPAPRARIVSSFTIVKGSLIDETYTVFRGWDFDRDVDANLRRVSARNIIGARSASWLRDVHKVLHRRFDPPGRDRPLVELAQGGCSLEIWKPLLLWHMTRDELLLRDFLTEWLYEEWSAGALRLQSRDLHPYLHRLVERGLVEAPWSDSTLERVANSLLRIATDFGLLEGKQTRRFTSYRLPDDSFLYLLHAIRAEAGGARETITSTDWRMFRLDAEAVERELLRLHQFRRLRYDAAGSIVRLTLPCDSPLAYAKELVA